MLHFILHGNKTTRNTWSRAAGRCHGNSKLARAHWTDWASLRFLPFCLNYNFTPTSVINRHRTMSDIGSDEFDDERNKLGVRADNYLFNITSCFFWLGDNVSWLKLALALPITCQQHVKMWCVFMSVFVGRCVAVCCCLWIQCCVCVTAGVWGRQEWSRREARSR